MTTTTTTTTRRLTGDRVDTLRRTAVSTPIGTMTVVGSEAGIRAILWDGEDAPEGVVPDDGVAVLADAVSQLDEYFAGHRTTFDLPLDLAGTEFQVQAWRALADVPFGTTVTYGEQARRLGRPTAFRAVGAANGRNPVPIVLPCHRVVGADGSLTGFGGGLDTKRWLLDHEQHDRLF
jgi:methylated-DNA-[protein]-cysteine S-methyltransferase